MNPKEPRLDIDDFLVEDLRLVKSLRESSSIYQIVEQFDEDQKYYESLGPE
jgi:hypothetical protein